MEIEMRMWGIFYLLVLGLESFISLWLNYETFNWHDN